MTNPKEIERLEAKVRERFQEERDKMAAMVAKAPRAAGLLNPLIYIADRALEENPNG